MLYNAFQSGSNFTAGRGNVPEDGAIDKPELKSRVLFGLTFVVAAVLIWLIILVNLLPS